MIGIGIDTGGTYTDAVLFDLDGRKVLGTAKSPTTKTELEVGIRHVLDKLDQGLVKQAEILALSTTLATNACLEDKGSRAKALMIGLDPDKMANLEQVYASYGFRDMSQLVFIDGKPENMFRHPKEPDWDGLEKNAKTYFANCAAVGITPVYPQADGGRLESTAKQVLSRALPGTLITTAYEMFDENEVLKRGAGTLLNARLIPLIAEFMKAVRHVMEEREIHASIAIVRSDGSLMSEEMAMETPVETLLSGPAASVVGGSELAKEPNAVLVDMGGTTTDIALVRAGQPILATEGINIGKWKTSVKGLYVDTFLLGGDSAVRYDVHGLMLDKGRVIPLTVLANDYPNIVKELQDLSQQHRCHTRMIHEYYVLLRDISGKEGYTEEEQTICRRLLDGPKRGEVLAELLHTDIYRLNTKRLEEEGIIIKSGLTPTDMMAIKGDFKVGAPDAALAALKCISYNIHQDVEEIPDMVYDLVVKRMYCNIVRILLEQEHPKSERFTRSAAMKKMIEWSYEAAAGKRRNCWLQAPFTTKLPLVGVGAPIHIFLPKVAELLNTTAKIQENAQVANALGAIASRIVTRLQIRVKAVYVAGFIDGYSVFEGSTCHMFEDYEPAENFAKQLVKRQVLDRARHQGASGTPGVTVTVEKIGFDGLFFESVVEAVATDEFRV